MKDNKTKEFVNNMTSNNKYLWFHVLCAGLWSWGWKTVGVDHEAIFQTVVLFAIGYEVLQYAKMYRSWKGWSWTPYRSKFKWQGDATGDIVGAILVSYWILF